MKELKFIEILKKEKALRTRQRKFNLNIINEMKVEEMSERSSWALEEEKVL